MRTKIKTHDKGRNHLRELLVDDEVVSSLTVIDYQMRIGSAQVRMGGIGEVKTKEKYRKKGYMRMLMEDTVKYMKNEGYDVSMLFGIPNFYTKFGYAVCLPSHKLIVSTRDAEDAKNSAGDYKFRKIGKEDIGPLLELYNENNQGRTCSIVRIKEHFSGFTKGSRYGQPTDNFLVEDNNGQLLAYTVFDKSEQEVNIIEVESRENKIFPTLVYEFAKMAILRRCGNINLFMPPDHPFAEFSHRYGCELITQYPKNGGGMMRIINQRTLFEKMKGELRQRISGSIFEDYSSPLEIRTDIGSTVLQICYDFLNICSGQKVENSFNLPQAKLIQLIVGYRTARDILNDSEVEISISIEPLVSVLFPKANPYVWLADHF